MKLLLCWEGKSGGRKGNKAIGIQFCFDIKRPVKERVPAVGKLGVLREVFSNEL